MKDIPNFENLFQISEEGVVFNTITGKIVPQHDNGKGYKKVTLKGKSFYVHRLVMLTFKGEPEDTKMVVDHKDRNRSNNHLSNLRYLSNRDNTIKGGKTNCTSKLRGVAKDGNRFRSTIIIEKIRYFLGRFDDELTAHEVYMEALNNWNKFKIKPNDK